MSINVVILTNKTTMENFLKKLDFDEKESSIYLACLKGKLNTPASLSRQTGVKRSTVYFYLEKLKEKGIIAYKIKAKKKYIIAIPPRQALKNLIEKKEEEIIRDKKIADKLVPQLEKITRQASFDTQVNYYSGKEGLRIVMNKIIEEKKDIYWIGSLEIALSAIGEDRFYRLLTLKRMKQTTSSYAITDKRLLLKKRFSERLGDFRHFRFLDKNFEIPALLVLFGNNIGIMSEDNGKIKIVLINDSAMSQIIYFTFRSLWDRLPKN